MRAFKLSYLNENRSLVSIIKAVLLFGVLSVSCSNNSDSELKRKPLQDLAMDVSLLKAEGLQLKAKPTAIITPQFITSSSYSNQIPVGEVETIEDSSFIVNTPGCNGFKNPDTITPQFSKRFATQPIVTLAKDGSVRDNNRLSISSYSKLQGLVDNVINTIYSDSRGNIWLGTDEGAVRYDGKWLTTYTTNEGLHSNEVISIKEDKEGNIWFGHYAFGGVSKFDGKTISCFSNALGLEDAFIWSLHVDSEGSVWFGTANSGLYRYNGKNLVRYGESQGLSDNVYAIIEDDKHRLWLASGSNICRFDGNSFTYLFTNTTICSKNGNVNNLMLDNKGAIWFSSSYGAYMYDGVKLKHFSKQSGLSDNYVLSMLQDSKGNYWFGTNEGGVSRFDGKYFSHITMKDGLTNNTIFSIYEDNGGDMWFGTWTGGLCKYSGDLFTHFAINEGLPENNIISMFEDNEGVLWMGTYDNGLCKYKNGVFYKQNKSISFEEDNAIFSMIQDRSKTIWIGFRFGVGRLRNGKMERYLNNETERITDVNSIYEDLEGNIWFSSNNSGVVKWIKNDNRFVVYSVEQGLPSNDVSAIFQDSKGLLWLGTNDKGFGYLEGDTLHWISKLFDGDFPSINAITEDKLGNKWIGSRGKSLFVLCTPSISNTFLNHDFGQKAFKINQQLLINYSPKEGKEGNNINALITTKDGSILLGTDFGLLKVDKSVFASDSIFVNTLIFKQSTLFKSYESKDGFLGVGVNRGNNGQNILERNDGRFWIAANNMVTTFNPNNQIKKKTQPIVEIVKIELSDEPIDWIELSTLKSFNDSTIEKFVSKDTLFALNNGAVLRNCHFDSLTSWNNLPYNLSLSYRNNKIGFDFVSPSISDSHKLKYQYILEGFDSEWSYPTNQSSVTYANLLPKSYKFKVKGLNSDGMWSEPIEFAFSIRPPWWQTNWFYISSILLVLLLLYIAYRVRTASLHATQRRLKMQIDIATLEISNSNAILIQQYDELTQKSFIVSEQKEELEAQRDAISSQKSELEMVYNELNKSIDYAMQIQYNVLPDFSEVKQFCDGYFIFFKPRDFVSGDFYWCSTVEGRLILTVADCTGHGVPGGFMSMLGMTYLNQIVTKEYITQPEVILKKLRREIITTLKQSGNFSEHKDGMDISLCSIDVKTLEMQWAGAYNPCVIVRDGELIEIKGDKMPIGIHDRMDKFTLHHFQLKKGDLLYLFSDGYGDQFGGPNDKRFSSKNFKNLLLKISSLSMDDQFNELDSTLSNWMSEGSFLNEQIDDITVVGVRI